MNKKSIHEVAKTYKLMLESPQSPQQGGGGGPASVSDLMNLLNTYENPTTEQLQNITPKPKGFDERFYYWHYDRWVRNEALYNSYMDELAREHAREVARLMSERHEEMIRRGIASKGRMAIIQSVIAALIAAGLFAYITYEQIEQIVNDYFDPMPQVDVPPNFELYQPFGNMWNNLGSEQGGYIPGGIFGG